MKRIIILCCALIALYAEKINIEEWNIFQNVRAVVYSNDGKFMAVAHQNNHISLRNATGNMVLFTLKGHFHYINALAFSSDGALLASAGQDMLIKVWSTSNGNDKLTLSGHSKAVTCLALSPNKKLLASGSEDNTIRIWSLATGKLLRTISDYSVAISQVSFSKDSAVIFASSQNHIVKLWKIEVTDSSRMASEIKDANSYYLQAVTAKEGGKLAQAIKSLETSLNMDPKQIDAYYLLACCYSLQAQKYDRTPVGIGNRNGDIRKAITALKDAVRNGFNNVEKIQKENDFDILRTEDAYRSIIAKFQPADAGSARRISFHVKNENGHSAKAIDIKIGKKDIAEEDVFEVGKSYEITARFKEYDTLKTRIRITSGNGPFVIEAPLRKLGKYKFFITGNSVELDGILYPYKVFIDGQPVEDHHMEIRKERIFTHYTVYAENTAKDIQIAAGYQIVSKRLYQIKNKGVRRLDQISAPLMIKHLGALANRGRGPIDAVASLEKLFKSIYWRKIFKKMTVDELLSIHDTVEKWEFYNESHDLRRRFVLDAINELIEY
ncbi:WD40 repeat domain-containing protein [Candidatus Uabimicrobium amorphum]|uniref:Anaphase-promoting complex subunit 4 WD40 domain-containing protein n=1 Tax=Uabimicrobium amorphum TaxID=2596890 RepID=A0A5S9IR28_UABAM|nr:WD40 repeat domain-containing protein [Candidatus Uabimicrobium amorphum]BBM86066.1 hypothetical protein UABAM_04452 [Candidatus Uabimicrobium amorphum]